MASNNVSSFLQKVRQGVRPNMFEVQLTFPTEIGLSGGGDDDLLTLMCKSAALQASNVGVIEVPFRGRTVKIAGDRTFDNWTATFINDKKMEVRSRFEEWLSAVNEHQGNKTKAEGGVDPINPGIGLALISSKVRLMHFLLLSSTCRESM